MIERCDYLDDAEDSPFIETYMMLALFIAGSDEIPEDESEL